MVERTSVLMRVSPEKTRMGPNSPRARPGEGGGGQHPAAGLGEDDAEEGLGCG